MTIDHKPDPFCDSLAEHCVCWYQVIHCRL